MSTSLYDIEIYLNKFAFWHSLDPSPVYVQIYSWNNTVVVNGYYQLDFIKELLLKFPSYGLIEEQDFFIDYDSGVVRIRFMSPYSLSTYYSIHNNFYYNDPLPSEDNTIKPFSMQVSSVLVTKIVPIFGSIEIIFTFSSSSVSTIKSISNSISFSFSSLTVESI